MYEISESELGDEVVVTHGLALAGMWAERRIKGIALVGGPVCRVLQVGDDASPKHSSKYLFANL